MKRKLFGVLAALSVLFSMLGTGLPASAEDPAITIDGAVDDWEGIFPVITDEGPVGTNISHVYFAKDASNIYIRIDGTQIGPVVPFHIGFDTDLNPATGYNTDADPGNIFVENHGIGIDRVVDLNVGPWSGTPPQPVPVLSSWVAGSPPAPVSSPGLIAACNYKGTPPPPETFIYEICLPVSLMPNTGPWNIALWVQGPTPPTAIDEAPAPGFVTYPFPPPPEPPPATLDVVSIPGYNHRVDADTFTSQEVQGTKNWHTKINNQTGTAVTGLELAINCPLAINPWPVPTTSTPPDYTWDFGDLASPGALGVGFGSEIPITYTPAFDVTRTITPPALSVSGQQTLTVTVTPRSPMMELSVNIDVREDSRINPQIISATGGGVYLNPDGRSAYISVQNPTVDQAYTFTIVIDVLLNPGADPVEHMPAVKVNEVIDLGSGNVPGNTAVTIVTSDPSVDATWSATGLYNWHWSQFRFETVELKGTESVTGNNAWVGFSPDYGYSTSGNSFTSQQVTGWKGCAVHAKSENGFTALTAGLNSSLTFSVMTPSPTTSTPPGYMWVFGDTQGASIDIASFSATVDFTPGFNATRSIDPLILTADGDQTMTISVTPLEPMDRLSVHFWVVEDTMMIPAFSSASVSPDPGADILISNENHTINIGIQNPTVNQTYTCTITIHVDLKDGVSSYKHMPWVNITQSNNVAGGTVTGSEVSYNIPGFGDWTVAAAGDYNWNWNASQNKLVNLRPDIGYPDLIVYEKHEEWVPGQEGVQYSVHYTIKNNGTGSAAPGHVTKLFVEGQEIETKEVPAVLAAGEQYSDSFTTILTLTGGMDSVLVIADSSNLVPESDEKNNNRSNTISWPALPDLLVYKYEQWVAEGDTYIVRYTLSNAGNAPAPAGHDIRLEVDGVTVETQPINMVLNPGQAYQGAFTQRALGQGLDRITVRVDANYETNESREDNNYMENTLAWPPAPDLVITSKNEKWTAGQEGSQYTVQFFLRNIGNAPAPAGSDVAIIVDGVLFQEIEVPFDLAPMQSFISVSGTITLSGSLDEIAVIADKNAEIAESVENNNGKANFWPVNMVYVGMIMTGESNPFADVRVRRAVYLGLDREVISMAMGGKKVLSIVIPPVPNPNINLTYNPDQAKQFLAEAGYPSGFQTPLYTTPACIGIAQAVQAFMAQIGIAVNTSVLPPPAFYSQLESGQFGMFITAEPVDWSQTRRTMGNLLLSGGPSNYTGYNNAGFDTQYGSGMYLAAENTAFSTVDGLSIVPLYWSQNPPQQTSDYTDLVVSEKHETWLVEGKIYTVQFTVKNTGLTTVPAGHHTLLIVDGKETDKIQVPVSLAPGGEFNGTFKSAIILTDGWDAVTIRADAGSTVAESNEGNNNLMNILSWPAMPELTLSISEEWVAEGQSYTVHYTVRNQGNAPAGPGHDLTLEIDGALIETVPVDAPLGPGESISGIFTQNTLTDGVDSIRVTVDVNNEVAESVENNNRQFKTLAWPAAPDLIIWHQAQSWVPGQEGSQYTVRFYVQNVGNAPAPAGHDVGISVDGTEVQQIAVSNIMQPGQLFTGFSNAITLADAQDTDEIVVSADCNGEVAESDENNNSMTATWPPSQQPPEKPDLKITKSEAWTSEANGAYRLNIRVENVGTQPLIGGFAVDVYIDRILQTGMHTVFTEDFAVDSFFDVFFDISLTGTSDEIIVTAAPLAQGVQEITENNNSVINVWGSPDLIISEKHEEWVNPGNHAEGYRVHFTVQNTGAGVAHSGIGQGLVGIDVGMTRNGIPIPVEKQVTLPGALNPGDTYHGFFDIIFPAPGGTWNDEISVTVDVNQECIESNEANNIRINLWPVYDMTYIGMNVNMTPFNDVRVRQAVYLAMDRDTIDNIISGSVKVQSITAPNSSNPNVNLAYNPDLAKMLLAEAGYPNGFKTDLYLPVYRSVNVAIAVKAYLAAIGIDATITVLDAAAYMSRFYAHDMGLFLTALPVWWEHPESILGKLLLSTSPTNATQYNNGTFDTQFGSGVYLDAENTAFSTANGLPIVPLYWSANPPVAMVIPGDANEDGVVNVLDMTRVARIILGLDSPTPGADANQDGIINVLDMTKIARIILGLD